MNSPLGAALARQGMLVLDGAMATELERHGADLSGGLWSARVLLDQPELITRVHRAYFEAGADVAITASYQGSVSGFMKLGLTTDEATQLISGSIQLARAARDAFWNDQPSRGDYARRVRPLVATSVGPYGAVLADGSEYRGRYALSFAELVRFHRDRLEILVEAGVEVLACETIPSLTEAEALVEAMADWPALTAWISFSARNEREVSDGTPIRACASFLDRQDQIVAVGVNCTALPYISPLITQLTRATDKPIVVYPNSGETWDAQRRVWVGSQIGADLGALALEWYEAGARAIGGCCRTRPADIRAISDALRHRSAGQERN